MGPGENTDLQTVLARSGPLDPARAVSIVRHIASALDDAHASQVVHRDIKPATILLTDDDVAYLADANAANDATDTAPLAYRAPELLSNTEMNYHADIYALACVLYECLTGSPPYPVSADAPALIAAHLDAPIPCPSQQRPQIPVGFDGVIARGMAKTPGDRYRSAGELATAAQHALATPSRQDAHHNHPSSRAMAQPQPIEVTQTVELRSPPAHPDHWARRNPPGTPGRLPPGPPGPALQLPPLSAVPSPPRRRSRRVPIIIAVVVAVIAVGVVAAIAIPGLTRRGSHATTPVRHTYTSSPTSVLPFTGLWAPEKVAVDGAGNVYALNLTSIDPATETKNVLKLAPGASGSTELSFIGVNLGVATDLAVDTAGNIYLSDYYAVWELAVGAADPVRLPFTGFLSITGVAVDATGNVYATGPLPTATDETKVTYGAMKLTAGAVKPTKLPVTGLYQPQGVAVDSAGNIYLADRKGNGRVLKLAPGDTAPAELPFTGRLDPEAVAVDPAGDVFVADGFGLRVLELPAGATHQIVLPFTKVRGPINSVAVDSAGNVYATTLAHKNDPGRVLKLAAG